VSGHSVPLRMCEVTLITITPIVEVVFEGVWNPREMCAMFARTTDTFSPSPRIFCVTPSTFHSSRIRTMSSHRVGLSVFRHHARSGFKKYTYSSFPSASPYYLLGPGTTIPPSQVRGYHPLSGGHTWSWRNARPAPGISPKSPFSH